MTPADKLEALILAKLEDYGNAGPLESAIEDVKAAGMTEGLLWVLDRLAAIRAELGDAVPVAWIPADEMEFRHMSAYRKPYGPKEEYVPLYNTPPATVPVEALREYCEDLNARADSLKTGIARASIRLARGNAYREIAGELTALIAAQEKK